MKSNSLLSKIQSWSLPTTVILTTFLTVFAQGQTSPEGHYRADTQIIFNLSACKTIPCELSYMFATVKVLSGTVSNGKLYHSQSKPIRIVTNLPIESIATDNYEGTTDSKTKIGKSTPRKANMVVCTRDGSKNWKNVGNRSDYILDLIASYNPSGCGQTQSEIYFYHIAVSVGSSVDIAENMKHSSVPMIAAYQGIAEHLSDFKQIVAKDSSDARHLARLESHLKAQIKMMVDEKGQPLLPITHRRVTEGSRMIMVLSTVLEEIMERYDFSSKFLEPLKPAKDSLSQLSKQLRTAYGWEDGLAGAGSKALLALSAILDSELRSMLSILSASNDATVMASFNAIMRANEQMGLRVKASNAGDIAGSELAKALLNQWNSQGWQTILSAMMSAPQATQAQLQNRILVSLTAIESIKDYVDPKGDSKLNVDLPSSLRARVPVDGRAVLP